MPGVRYDDSFVNKRGDTPLEASVGAKWFSDLAYVDGTHEAAYAWQGHFSGLPRDNDGTLVVVDTHRDPLPPEPRRGRRR